MEEPVPGFDDDEDEAPLEPRFKYERLETAKNVGLISNWQASKIFKMDDKKKMRQRATAIAVNDKFLAVGTNTGYIYIMDHLGNVHSGKVEFFYAQ